MSDKPYSRDLDKIIVRLPDGMRDRLAEVAAENKRSVNAEVVSILEAALSSLGQNTSGIDLERTVTEAAERAADLAITALAKRILGK